MKGLKHFVATALVCALLIQTEANIVGEIKIDGVTLYVWRLLGSVVIVENNTITVGGDSRAYLLQSPSLLIDPDEYYQVRLFYTLIA